MSPQQQEVDSVLSILHERYRRASRVLRKLSEDWQAQIRLSVSGRSVRSGQFSVAGEHYERQRQEKQRRALQPECSSLTSSSNTSLASEPSSAPGPPPSYEVSNADGCLIPGLMVHDLHTHKVAETRSTVTTDHEQQRYYARDHELKQAAEASKALLALAPSSHTSTQPQRGFQRWWLVVTVITIITLATTAVTLCIVLVAVPRQQASSTAANTTITCQTHYPCANRGHFYLSSSGLCQCMCTDNFTGRSCAHEDNHECQTTSFGSISNLTLGDTVTSIVSSAQARYGLYIDLAALSALFSYFDMTCEAENSLIDIEAEGRSMSATRGHRARQLVPIVDWPTPRHSQIRRRTTHTKTVYNRARTNASAVSGAMTPGDTSFSIDYSRAVVLYILVSTGKYESALAAREYLHDFFFATSTTLVKSSGIGLGSGFSLDMSTYRLTLANGTVVGGPHTR